MDIILERPERRIPRYVVSAIGTALLLVLVFWGIHVLMQRGSVSVDRATLITDVVRRGTFIQSIDASGTFEPQHIRIVSAPQDGIVQQVLVKPGTAVNAGSIIAVMDNPTLDANVTTAQAQLEVAQANLGSARQEARAAQLTQASSLSNAQSQLQENQLSAKALRILHTKGLVNDVQYRNAQIEAQKSANEVKNNEAQVDVSNAEALAKIAAAQAQVLQAQASLEAVQAQVSALTVRAGAGGIVQSIAVDPGTHASIGTELAQIANQHDLKVVLQVPEELVSSVVVGMHVTVDTGSDTLSGRVTRIAPKADSGSVAVDVTFPEELASGARANANVDGTIEISRIRNTALSMARPTGVIDNSSSNIFKVVDSGSRAVRVRVRLGAGSNDRIQILSGLNPGDTVILSDMSAYQDQTEIRLR